MAMRDSGWWFLKTMARKGRNDSGLSQREMGDEVDRSKDTIHDWETGKTDIPAHSIGPLAKACGLSEEISDYMKSVARARRNGVPIEADMRFNALFLALAEVYSGYIFKFDALLIPGPLQTEEYHYTVVRIAEDATDEQLNRGWPFKLERAAALEARADEPTVQFLIGEAALLQLRAISKRQYQDQMAHLRRWARKPPVEIRILRGPVPVRHGSFSIYMPGHNSLACPPFVYTEVADSSWCIDDVDRVASYDEVRKKLWNRAIGIEVHDDDDRCDRLA